MPKGTVKSPRRVYSTARSRAAHPDVWRIWLRLVKKHDAHILKNGELLSDYPDQAVAYETLNFGWVMSKPNGLGIRTVLEQF